MHGLSLVLFVSEWLHGELEQVECVISVETLVSLDELFREIGWVWCA